MPMKSWGLTVDGKGFSQELLGVCGEEVEDGRDVGRRGLRVEEGELQVLAAVHLGAGHDGLTGGEQGLAGVQLGLVEEVRAVLASVGT